MRMAKEAGLQPPRSGIDSATIRGSSDVSEGARLEIAFPRRSSPRQGGGPVNGGGDGEHSR